MENYGRRARQMYDKAKPLYDAQKEAILAKLPLEDQKKRLVETICDRVTASLFGSFHFIYGGWFCEHWVYIAYLVTEILLVTILDYAMAWILFALMIFTLLVVAAPELVAFIPPNPVMELLNRFKDGFNNKAMWF